VYEMIVKFWLCSSQNFEQPGRPGAILCISFTNRIKYNWVYCQILNRI